MHYFKQKNICVRRDVRKCKYGKLIIEKCLQIYVNENILSQVDGC